MASAAKRLDAVAGTPAPQISFDAVTLQLGGKTIIENLSLGVRPGEFLCIVGASGCGKTTALRLAAGLYQPTSGKVNFDGQPMLQPRREIAIVFQDYGKALLPWRTAAGNVSLALDAMTRQGLQDEVLALVAASGATVIFVTHDLDEAIYLGDRVIGLLPHPGRIGIELQVNLPRPRDQLSTREQPEFLRLRRQLFDFIKATEQ